MIVWFAAVAGAEPVVAIDLDLPESLDRGDRLELDLRDHRLVPLGELMTTTCPVEERWGRSPWQICTYRRDTGPLTDAHRLVLPVLVPCAAPGSDERYRVRRRHAGIAFVERCGGTAMPREWDFSDFVLLDLGVPGDRPSSLLPLPF